MRRLNRSAAALAAALLLPLGAQAPMAQGVRPAVAADAAQARVIVKYRADSDMVKKQAMSATGRRTLQAQAMGDRIGVTLTAGAGVDERAHVVTARGLSSSALAVRLAAQPDVEFAVVDERRHIVAVPNDPFYVTRAATASSGGPVAGQWYLRPPGTTGTTASINAEQAWDITTGSPSIVVAVLDTGVRKDHPDLLGGNMLGGYDMIAADSAGVFVTANDGNGRDADPSDPGDWVTQAEIDASGSGGPLAGCMPEPTSSWHGTQTLGLIGAATNNGAGIASVGRTVSVLPVRVLGKCGGFDSDIIVGMQWAANVYSDSELAALSLPRNPNPAKVISMSLGSTGSCSSMYTTAMSRITAAGVVVVASAGNTAGRAVSTPANCPGIIAVAGLRHVGDKVGFSDIGPEIAISAPGGNCINIVPGTPCLYPIMTTANSGTATPVAGAAGATYTDSFAAPSLGTSFSAPLVAGTVALMLSVQPTLTPAQVRSMLQQTARPFPTTGGTVSISIPTASPTATLPVSLAATEPPLCVPATSSSADQLECYCTTGTCGAGMLDVRAAVTLASGGGLITPMSSARRVVTYLWTLLDGGGIVTSIRGANTAAASVTPSGAGTFAVRLDTTDDLGVVSSTTKSVVVASAPITPPVTPPPSSGGGGALGTGWLLLLSSAVLALAALSRFERRRAARAVSAPARAARRR